VVVVTPVVPVMELKVMIVVELLEAVTGMLVMPDMEAMLETSDTSGVPEPTGVPKMTGSTVVPAPTGTIVVPTGTIVVPGLAVC
jgi:hypothetical protein